MKYKLFILTCIFLMLVATAQAKMQVIASIDDKTITTEDDTQISVEVSGSMQVEAPKMPHVPGLEIIQTGRTSQLSIVNGSMTSSAVFIYHVIPMDEGNFKIGSFTVQAGGKQYSSNTLTLNVIGTNYSKPPQKIQTQFSPSQTQQPSQGNNRQPADQTDPLFWIDVRVDKNQAYLSEQVLFYLTFYSRVHVMDADLKMPEFGDMLTEVVLPNKQGHEVVNGVQYATYEKIIALFPTKKGKVTINPASLDFAYEAAAKKSRQGWDPFTMGFGRRVTKNKTIKSKPLEVNVIDLPQPIPDNFTHLVGDFGMNANLSDTTVKAGESITLEVNFTGAGNVRSAVLPQINLPDVKIYRDKPLVETYQSQDGISGKKSFKVVLVPTKPGDMVIDDLTFTYFNLKEGVYKKLRLDAMNITVMPSDDEKTHAIIPDHQKPDTTIAQQQISYKDLAPLYANADEALIEKPLKMNVVLLYGVFWGLPILFLGLLLLTRINFSSTRNQKKQKRKNAYKKFRQTIQVKEKTSKTVFDATQEFMADVFQVAGQALTAKEMKELCLLKGVAEKIAVVLEKNMIFLEETQYGFAEQTVDANAIKELVKVLKEVDRTIK
ncbi:BatD family protein [bacterium]|nr:BatD family protein [bacterium]